MIKNKVSIKTIIIIVILILVGVLGVLGINTAKTYLSGASGDTVAKNVLAKPSEDGKSVIITWTSDKASVGVVEYGTTPASLLLRAPESEQTTNHSLTLSPLKVNTNYYFRIRVGDEVFDNNGIPYSFKTKVGAVITPTTALIPTSAELNASACDKNSDYNKDGIVNSLDYMSCLKNKPSGAVSNTISPTPSSTTTTTTTTTEKCSSGTDYNKDGVVNSLDRLKCLQDNK